MPTFHYTKPEDLPAIIAHIQSMDKAIVEVRKPNRSKDQNSFWHGFVGAISSHTGYTPEQTKMILKKGVTDLGWMKMYETITTKKGIQIDDYVSSADLNKEDFSLLMKYTIEVCDQMGIKYKYDPIAMAEFIFS